MKPESLPLEARMERLEQENAVLRLQVETMEQRSLRERRRLRVQAGLAFIALLGAIFVSPASRKALADGYGLSLAALNTRLTAVEAKTQYMSIGGEGDMYVKGTNLHIENGLPNPGVDIYGNVISPVLNGKGNLIIGYNTTRLPYDNDIRTGSHNLIVGDQNNYTSYGGIVVGLDNTTSAPYASVSGGAANSASGKYSSVTGGAFNRATNDGSAVSGGSFIRQSFVAGWSAASYHAP